MNLLDWLNNSSILGLVLETSWIFPIVEIIHIFGMTLIIGGLVVFDVRLLGLISCKSIPIRSLMYHIAPWLICGFILSLFSGLTFFASDTTRYWGNTSFQIKLVLLVLALINQAVFYFKDYPEAFNWNSDVATPLSARLSAVISLVLIFGILTAGRLIPYVESTQ